MWWLLAVPALAADPEPKEEVEIVKPEYREGKVLIRFPGRDGETVRCDGWTIGKLPLETTLLEGVHTFEVTGKKPFTIATRLTFEDDAPLKLDLSKAVPVDVDAPTGIHVISTTSSRRRADGSVVVEIDEEKEPEVAEESDDEATSTP